MGDFWHEFVAGSLGGMFGVFLGHPADTVKVRQQALSVGVRTAVTNTFRNEGPHGFFKGMAFPLLANGALNAIYFGVYSNTLRALDWALGGRPAGDQPAYGRVFTAGCVGGVAQLVVAVPVDLVKIQLQTRTVGAGWRAHPAPAAAGPVGCLVELYRSGGVRSWYHGLGAMAARDVYSFGLYIALYERLSWEGQRRGGLSPAAATLLAGGAAGLLAWSSCLPLDVLKSRLQADDPARPMYRGLLHCAQLTLLRDGPRALVAGFSMMAVRAFIVNAATFLGYEYSLVAMRRLGADLDVH